MPRRASQRKKGQFPFATLSFVKFNREKAEKGKGGRKCRRRKEEGRRRGRGKAAITEGEAGRGNIRSRCFGQDVSKNENSILRWEPVPRTVGGTGCPKSKFFAKTIFEDLCFCLFRIVRHVFGVFSSPFLPDRRSTLILYC